MVFVTFVIALLVTVFAPLLGPQHVIQVLSTFLQPVFDANTNAVDHQDL